MEYIKWNDELSVKIDSIDAEHKKLIGLINQFYDGISSKSSREKIVEIVKGLKEYTAYHFATEEKYMKQFGYPGFDEHKAQHDAFVEKVMDYSERLKDGRFVISLEITNFIKEWITKHIMGTDKKYSAFLVAKGVK
jgi:hemerythrin